MRHLDLRIELRIGKKSVCILECRKDGARHEIIFVIRQSVDDSEVVIFVAIGSGRKEPNKSLDTSRKIVKHASRDILGLHGFVGTLPRRDGIELIVKERSVGANCRIIFDQLPQGSGRFLLIGAGIHRLGMQVPAVTGIRVIGIDVDARSALTTVQRSPRKVSARIRLRSIDDSSLLIRFMYSLHKGFQQPAIFFGVWNRIPIIDVLFIPKGPVGNAPAKMLHHPLSVSVERGDLLRCLGRPKDRIEATVGVVKRTRSGNTDVRQFPRRRGIHSIAVQELHLDENAVINERVHVVIDLLRHREDAALLLDPIPTRPVGAVLVLPDADPFKACIKQPRPPAPIPRQVRIAGKVGVDPKAISNLRRTLGRDVRRQGAPFLVSGNRTRDYESCEYKEQPKKTTTQPAITSPTQS